MAKAGRPKAELDLPEGWQDEIISLYSEGASDVEVKALIIGWRGSISNDLWERWMQEEKDFSETIKIGKALSAAWWERVGRKQLGNKEFSYTGWYMNMKNRFGWADKQVIDNTSSDGSMQPVINIIKPKNEE